MAVLQSLQREELDYRGIYLLETAITFPSRADGRSFVPCSIKHVQPPVTVFLSHSAVGIRHLLGFHLLPLSPKVPPLPNPHQTFLSRVLISCSGQQQVLTYSRQESSFIAIISYLAVSRVALGFPQALRTCCCLSTAMCTMHPCAGQGHLHQHPIQRLGRAMDSFCTVQSGCAAARCHHCWFAHLLSWKCISKKNQGGHPSHIHKQAVFTGKKEIKTSALLLPASNQLMSILEPC